MQEADVRQIISALDHALRIFRQNEGHLTATQIRARSMLSVTRTEMAQALSEAGEDHGAEFLGDGAVVMTPVALGHTDSKRSA